MAFIVWPTKKPNSCLLAGLVFGDLVGVGGEDLVISASIAPVSEV